jgi:choline dehydrogenase-like flavoprotein
MLLDARVVPAGTTLTADVCVVGAGAAGITLARALAGSGHTVLLLESGGFELDDPTQALYRGKTVGLPIDPVVDLGLDSPRLRYFGGTTNHWAGFCRPFPALDFETRSYVPRSGWPIARADLDQYYAAAQGVVGLGPYEYSLAYWRDRGLVAQPLLEDPSTPHAIVQLTGRPRFGPVYRDEIVNSARVQLVLWANVTRIALSDDGNSVTGVDVKTLGKNDFTATAPAYVLATGGLEVPRLLLASNDRRPAGIGNEHDLVGRCFMEHVNIAAGPIALTSDEAALAPYTPTSNTIDVDGESRDVGLQAVLLLPPELMRQRELRACEVTLEFPFGANDPRIRTVYPTASRGVDLLDAEKVPVHSVATARVLCEQEPNPASRVTLVRKKDALGMPRIQLDWRLTRDDRISMLRTLRVVGRQIGARGLGRLQVDIDGFVDAEPSRTTELDYAVNTGSHHLGTARMSASPRQGVVDPDGKVHSVANLYVAGSAVFPTSGANTPTLTIVALALRLADHLAAVVPGTAPPPPAPAEPAPEETAPAESVAAVAEPVDGPEQTVVQ